MFTGREIAELFTSLGVTDVIWVPDSALGAWESDLAASTTFDLLRVCREGEAWPLAAGLHLGGKRPLILMQCTGLFESGDAVRNVLWDMQLPLLAIIGLRNELVADSKDTAKRFALPIVEAWGVDYRLIASEADKPHAAQFLRDSIAEERTGFVLLAEGK